ncbi:type III-B CRISPR-associated protein Cas10/Cmr2 [Caldicellulosiruptor morganii]|uniref:Type III-B CRISPR-associated protein Cas10/Cmr2 n=1 Tax=Caldicellulosiruptor morganii TaxID=1387555 RepID=A0ABY7BLN3_9FIRM|nr:type III-B CRISPR-associated protein Cas10/Cmr2 [Caldicellulosiruptor morganii]WAM33724.1 type III-B CRISPR-associated protein Cas10/Cmr2 [Caldicellulosiruptor morganii]
MGVWKLKLKAFLHDPLDKQWVLSFDCPKNKEHESHEMVSEKLLNYILPNECIEEFSEITKIADEISYPMNEINEILENLKKPTIIKPEEICFHDIYSRKIRKKVINKYFKNKHKRLEKFFQLLGNIFLNLNCNDEEKAKLAFLLLWQYVPDFFKWVTIHPADSQIPSHSIYNHLVQTSAIATAITNVNELLSGKLEGDIPAFLIFTIGPVQSFIAKARKTQDLWAGSYILSYLTYKSLEPLIDELGPDMVIYPNLRGQPLIERWLHNIFSSIRDKNESFEQIIESFKAMFCHNNKEDNEQKLLIANIPNRFLAFIPFSRKNIADKCKESLTNTLTKFAKEIDTLVKEEYLKDFEINPAFQDEIKNQLLSYFQVYYAVLPWTTNKCNLESGGNIPGELTSESVFNDHKILFEKSEIRNLIIEEIIKLNQNSKNGDKIDYSKAGIGRSYPLLIDLLEKLLGARKSIRDFQYLPSRNREKCHLCGENEIVSLSIDEKQNKSLWEKLRKKEPGLLKENERLCSVCLFKRFFPKLLEKELEIKVLSFPSTSEIASIPAKVELLKNNEEFVKKFVEKYNNFKNSIEASGRKLPFSETVPALKKMYGGKYCSLCSIDGQWLMIESYSKDYLKNEFGIEKIDESFLRTIGEIKELLYKENLNFSRYFAILQMDGDHMGKWIRGFGSFEESEKIEFPTIKETIHEKVLEDLQNNFKDSTNINLDSLIEKVHPSTPTYHQILSSRLISFALHEVRRIVEEKYFGKLIYAGGDDVLALLPVNTVLNCAYELQKRYKEVVNSRATMSAGIVIAHHKYPLSLALKAVSSAEKKAKNLLGRNAFCVQLITHSGETKESGGKWDLVDFINKIRNDLQNGSIPKVFCNQIIEIMNQLLNVEQESVSQEIVEILKLEIRRLWQRKKKYEGKKPILKIEDVIERFEKYIAQDIKNSENSLLYKTQKILMFGYLFYLAKFLTGKDDLNL